MIFERHHECKWTRLLACADETQVAPELPTEVGIVLTDMLTQSKTATTALHKQTRGPPGSSNKQDKCNLGQTSIMFMLDNNVTWYDFPGFLLWHGWKASPTFPSSHRQL
jgi:hypothetical protein